MVIALKHPQLFSDKVNWAILRENGLLPVSKMIKAPCPGVATSSKGLLRDESDLLIVRISDSFDSEAYKLIEESRYHFSKPPSPRNVIDTKPYGLNDT